MRLAAGAEGEVRFELWAGEERVGDGAAGVEEIAHDPFQTAPGERLPSDAEFPPIEELVPHRPPALLLRRLLAREGDGLAALAAVPRDSPFVARDRAPSYLALEMAAQTAAALEELGREQREQGAPRAGYLVGIREAALPRAWLAVEAPYTITVRPAAGAPPLAVYDLRAEAGGVVYATGTLSAYLA